MEKTITPVEAVQPQITNANIRSTVATAGRLAAGAVGFVCKGLFDTSGLKIQIEPGVTREVHNQSDDLVRIQTKRYLM